MPVPTTEPRGRALRPAVLGAALALVALAGCTDGPDVETPVPTRAEGAYLCPGVPEDPVALMTGREGLAVSRTTGAWGGDDALFVCSVEDGDGDAVFTVTEQDLASASTSVEALLEENPDHQVIESGTDRGGVSYQSGDQALARFVCDDRFLSVEVFAVAEGRDGADDTARYLTSLLPWACDGDPVPD